MSKKKHGNKDAKKPKRAAPLVSVVVASDTSAPTCPMGPAQDPRSGERDG